MGTRIVSASLAAALLVLPATASAQVSDRAQAAADPELIERTELIIPGIDGWRFADTADPAIWLDVVWVGRELPKRAREVSGDLLFYDQTGRVRFGLGVELQQPIGRNDAVTQTGIGIAYDASRQDHQWLRTTPLSSMSVDFRAKRVLYEDGELKEY